MTLKAKIYEFNQDSKFSNVNYVTKQKYAQYV